MIRKSIIALIALLVIGALIIGGCAAPVPSPTPTKPAPAPTTGTSPTAAPAPAAKAIELNWANMIGPGRPRWEQGFLVYQQKVEKDSNGKIKFINFPSEALSKAKDIHTATITGVADIGSTIGGYTPDRFVLTDAVQLPGTGITNSKQGSYVLRDLIAKYPEVAKEWADVHLIGFDRCPPFGIMTNKVAIRTPADAKGLILRTGGGPTDAVTAIGAVTMIIGMPDVYMALQKGTIDGAVTDPGALFSRKLYEVENYFTYVDMGGAFHFTAMNNDTWKSLPQDVQKVFNDNTQYYIDTMSAGWDAEVKQALDIKPASFQFITLTPEQQKAFTDLTASVRDRWVTANASKGPTKAILDDVLALAQKHKDVK